MENLGRLLKLANNSLSKEMNDFASQYGLTGVQMSTLDLLAKSGGSVEQSLIEQEFNIKRSTTTVMLQRMEAKQLVERLAAPDDKRKKLVKLLPKAQELVGPVQAYIDHSEQKLRANFSQAELAATKKVLTYLWEGGM